LETRDGKGKLLCTVQNLREEAEKFSYRLYVIKSTENGFSAAEAGEVKLKKSSGELSWDFDPGNVGGAGMNVDEINAAAVVVVPKGRILRELICPLAGYKVKAVSWREKLQGILRSQAAQKPPEVKITKAAEKPEAQSIHRVELESRHIPVEAAPDFNISQRAKERAFEDTDSKSAAQAETVVSSTEDTDGNIPGEACRDAGSGDMTSSLANETEASGNEGTDDGFGRSVEFAGFSAEEALGKKEAEEKQNYMSKLPCGIPYNTGIDSPCSSCRMKHPLPEDEKAGKPDGDLSRVAEGLDRNFERSDPFNSRRKDYKWWKIGSPVHLNNILYQSGIKTPLLFNPSLMMAHFKYRHLIFGIYSDKVQQKDYLVCGVPGVFNVDDKPFGNLCRWAQLEGTRPKYGAFGYWLVYMDPKTGRFLCIG
jgi:hypothetical protein